MTAALAIVAVLEAIVIAALIARAPPPAEADGESPKGVGESSGDTTPRDLGVKLQSTQRVESLGLLAGGIAHHFNNLLVGILGNVGMILEDLEDDSPDRRPLEEVEDAAQRAAEICHQMLTYAGQRKLELQAIDLRDVVISMRDLVELSVAKRATIAQDFDQDLPSILGDLSQLRQVLMNLVMNAAESIEHDHGKIVVALELRDFGRQSLDGKFLGHKIEAGPYVILSVSDNGSGMSKEAQARLFEPFYTTKEAWRGLGMSAVMGIIQSHEGAITVNSTLGRGTLVSVLFPAHRGAASPVPDLMLSAPRLIEGGRILIVDDEAMVRDVAARILKRAGFEVDLASSGQAAINILRRSPGDFSCVLLDYTMPQMDGRETLLKLRAIRPDLPIAMSSGHGEAQVAELFSSEKPDVFLQKPYRSESLIASVTEAISARAPAGDVI